MEMCDVCELVKANLSLNGRENEIENPGIKVATIGFYGILHN